jgi:hypothetical protein
MFVIETSFGVGARDWGLGARGFGTVFTGMRYIKY